MSSVNSFSVVQCSSLVVLSIANFMKYVVLALEGPFYPPEVRLEIYLATFYYLFLIDTNMTIRSRFCYL